MVFKYDTFWRMFFLKGMVYVYIAIKTYLIRIIAAFNNIKHFENSLWNNVFMDSLSRKVESEKRYCWQRFAIVYSNTNYSFCMDMLGIIARLSVISQKRLPLFKRKFSQVVFLGGIMSMIYIVLKQSNGHPKQLSYTFSLYK